MDLLLLSIAGSPPSGRRQPDAATLLREAGARSLDTAGAGADAASVDAVLDRRDGRRLVIEADLAGLNLVLRPADAPRRCWARLETARAADRGRAVPGRAGGCPPTAGQLARCAVQAAARLVGVVKDDSGGRVRRRGRSSPRGPTGGRDVRVVGARGGGRPAAVRRSRAQRRMRRLGPAEPAGNRPDRSGAPAGLHADGRCSWPAIRRCRRRRHAPRAPAQPADVLVRAEPVAAGSTADTRGRASQRGTSGRPNPRAVERVREHGRVSRPARPAASPGHQPWLERQRQATGAPIAVLVALSVAAAGVLLTEGAAHPLGLIVAVPLSAVAMSVVRGLLPLAGPLGAGAHAGCCCWRSCGARRSRWWSAWCWNWPPARCSAADWC